ncbi:MAG: carbamoyl-phosphate synthase small subunit [Phycisphaerales bacterium]|nr:MAG: carbamoyl-phosphate synthase small subunit [Phycisphaerales bacterium]
MPTSTQPHPCLLSLEDGTVFRGTSFGAPGSRTGEVVFNTALTGYQETLTDPSYCGQIVTMTYPHMGNYGVNPADVEAVRPQVAGFVAREVTRRPSNFRATQSLSDYLAEHGIIGIEGVDTRALTRRLRVEGAMRGIITTEIRDLAECVARARAAPSMNGADLVREVAPREAFDWTGGGLDAVYTASRRADTAGKMPVPQGSGTAFQAVGDAEHSETTGKMPVPQGMTGKMAVPQGMSGKMPAPQGITGRMPVPHGFTGRMPVPHESFRVAAVDCGMKRNILRHLVDIGATVRVFPPTARPEELLAFKPDGVFISNGPGDPAPLDYAIELTRGLLGKVPTFGICLGHQIIALALGGESFKLKFGHRGANQPVLNTTTGRVEITSQNHGFAIHPESLRKSGVQVTHVNLNDKTLEGFVHPDQAVLAIQYHPEASPGPHDATYLFDCFADMMRTGRAPTAEQMAEAQARLQRRVAGGG